jgi:hypothetical protein
MTTERQIRANRANARLSTGPRTAQGKARSSRSAFRHGLSIAVLAGSGPFFQDVEDLARRIAGEDPSAVLLEYARRVAEAQVDLGRIRQVRGELLSRIVPDGCSSASPGYKVAPRRFATRPSKQVLMIQYLDRYERCALSRRKRAISVFHAARAELPMRPATGDLFSTERRQR